MKETADGDPTVALDLDCRGLLCPLPARETERALQRVRPGEVVRVRCTDPASRVDLAALCARSGDRLVRSSEADGEWIFWIRRRTVL